MAEETTAKIDPAVREEVEKLAKVTKRGFDPRARLKGRGLRKGNVMLFLNDEKGLELGWAYDARDQLGNLYLDQKSGKPIRVREGIEGELDAALELKALTEAAHADAVAKATVLKDQGGEPDEESIPSLEDTLAPIEKKIEELTERRDTLVAEMKADALAVKLRAVPPVIQKNTHRLAKQSLNIKGKVPEDEETQVAFKESKLAHLMTVMVTEMRDTSDDSVNDGVTYEDAMDLIGYLPPGQLQRLDAAMGRVQFTDTISASIEGQEDFS